MSAAALRFMDERLQAFGRDVVNANMEAVLRAVAWTTFDDAPCRCGDAVLAARARTSERTVRRALDRAEALGIVRRMRACRVPSGGRGGVYNTVVMVGFNDDQSNDQPANVAGRSDERPTGQTCATNRPKLHDQPANVAGAYIASTSYQQTINQLPQTPNRSDGSQVGEKRVFDESEARRRCETVRSSSALRQSDLVTGNNT